MKLNKQDKIEILNLLYWKECLKKAIKNGSYKLKSFTLDKPTKSENNKFEIK